MKWANGHSLNPWFASRIISYEEFRDSGTHQQEIFADLGQKCLQDFEIKL